MASDSEGRFRSDLIRRALGYYIRKNPDGIKALAGDSNIVGPRKAKSTTHHQHTEVHGVYDPLEDTQRKDKHSCHLRQ